MKKFYPVYSLRAEEPGRVAIGPTTFRVGGVGGVLLTAEGMANLPKTVAAAIGWVQKSGLPPVVCVEFTRPQASKETIYAWLRGTSEEPIVEEMVAHATAMARVLLLGGSIINLKVEFYHTEIDGLEQPHSRNWNVSVV